MREMKPAANISKKQRAEIGKKAAAMRWKNKLAGPECHVSESVREIQHVVFWLWLREKADWEARN
jgi:hypothetical protein